jgi:hypothetical protein
MQITHASTVWKMDGLGSKFNLFKNCIYLGDICVPYKEFFISFILIVTSLDCHRPFVLLFQMVFF